MIALFGLSAVVRAEALVALFGLDVYKRQDLDFTKWLHDLYRPSFYPYDPKELRLIARVNALADRRDAERLSK